MLQVSAKLGEMDRMEVFHCFQFDQYVAVHYDVGPISGRDHEIIEADRDWYLAFHRKTRAPQAMDHACSIGIFEQAGSQPRMHIECSCQDALGQFPM